MNHRQAKRARRLAFQAVYGQSYERKKLRRTQDAAKLEFQELGLSIRDLKRTFKLVSLKAKKKSLALPRPA